MNCSDCGTKLELNGTCPNCHEELFIARWQGEYMEHPLSEDFSRKVEEQAEAVARRRGEYDERNH